MRYHNGAFYIVCAKVSLDLPAENFILTSTDPHAGHWSDPIPVEFHGMDSSLFFDDDGKLYYQGALFPANSAESMVATIVQLEIDISTGKLLSGSPRKLWDGFTGGSWPEGPHLYKRRDWYYLMIAEGGTAMDDCVTMARSRSPWGPFTGHPENSILTNRGTDKYIQAVGHADMFEDNRGLWWALALAVRVNGDSFPLCRETHLCPVDWTEGGWPLFNGGKPLEQHVCINRTLSGSAQGRISSTTEYTSTMLHGLPQLPFLRNPDSSCYEWPINGDVVLTGQDATLNEEYGASTFVGIRQRHLSSVFTVTLNFQPTLDTEEAGITVCLDRHRHYDFCTSKSSSQKRVLTLCTKLLRSETAVRWQQQIPTGKVTMRIKSTELPYHFEFRGDDDSGFECWQVFTSVATSAISDWGFTDKPAFFQRNN